MRRAGLLQRVLVGGLGPLAVLVVLLPLCVLAHLLQEGSKTSVQPSTLESKLEQPLRAAVPVCAKSSKLPENVSNTSQKCLYRIRPLQRRVVC